MPLRAFAAVLLAPSALLPAQMHSVARPDQVTRAVAVYEYVGDLQHPRAARLTPVSLFIGGHFEDAGVYLARPVPFALDGGLRYELQHAGVRQDFFDVVASRHFTSTTAASASPFDNSWFGYGRIAPLPRPKVAKLRPNCGNARVVQEAGTPKKDDGKPHFGTKPAAEDASAQTATQTARRGRNAAPDPCLEEEAEKPERISLADDRKKDDAPDPERPTLHRSPATTANNTGAEGKPDKKAPKPPPATITANGGPADDPDRPTIRHKTAEENDPNALPPDPIDLASRERSPATAKGETEKEPASAAPMTANDTVAEGGTITAGNLGGGPVLRRGKLSAPPPEPAPPVAKPSVASGSAILPRGTPPGSPLAAPLEAMIAISDAKERTPHDFTYHFTSTTERAAALGTLQGMAMAVLANPALATDAPDGSPSKPVAAQATAPQTTAPRAGAHPGAHTTARPGAAARTRVHAAAQAAKLAAPTLQDEEMAAYQLYYGAPVTYSYTARMPATAAQPERFVTVIAQTDADGKLQPAMRSVTDATHLDRTPRYRLIDVVDADGSNRASLLMELRAQHSRQFALYRLLGNRPDQIFVSGSTLL